MSILLHLDYHGSRPAASNPSMRSYERWAVVIAGGWPLLIDATARIHINDVGANY